MRWHGSASGKRGGSQACSDTAIRFCLTIKKTVQLGAAPGDGHDTESARVGGPGLAGTGLQHRQSAPEAFGRDDRGATNDNWPAPASRQHRCQDAGLRRVEDEKAWCRYRRQWRKVHLGIDATTLEIRAIEVTDNATGDAPMLPYLLDQIAEDETIASVSGDGAYDTKACHEAIAQRGAQAIIPARRNAKLRKDKRFGAASRNAILDATRRLGRRIWKNWTGYRRRSFVETKMRCFKLLGKRLMARDFDLQVAELQVRAAILNRFTRLGTPMTVRMP
jgi:hypothetical protein